MYSDRAATATAASEYESWEIVGDVTYRMTKIYDYAAEGERERAAMERRVSRDAADAQAEAEADGGDG